MSVRIFIILGVFVTLASPTPSYALPACSGQRFYLKSGEGLDVEFNRKPGCDVRFMTVQQGSVERRLFYSSKKTDTRVLTPSQPDVSEAWAELPTKVYLRAGAETIVRFTAERPPQSAPQPTLTSAPMVPAQESATSIRILVENKTNEVVTHYWVNPSGREISYGNIAPGATATLNTFDRHVWRLKRTNNAQMIRQFTATSTTGTIRIEPNDLPSMPSTAKASSQPWLQGFASSAAPPFSRGGRISTTDSVNVRSGPSLSAAVSGVLQNRAQGTIVDGPQAQDGYTWWRIRYDNGVEGWTADKFIRVGGTGQPRQERQSIDPWIQPFGGTNMGFLSNLWSVMFTLFWVGLIGGLIYAGIKMFMAGPVFIFRHWHMLVETLQESPMSFYQSLEESINKRQIPDFTACRIKLPEGGVFSARREYLRVRRKDLIMDICAAPFGTGFFVSWWLGPKLGFLNFIYALPFMGVLAQYVTRPWTYYRLDTAIMFSDAVHNAVQDIIKELTTARGLRALSEVESKPMMRDFFNR